MLSVIHLMQTSAFGPINHRASFCFVLFVFFAEIGPVTITTDPKKFQYELRELYVQVGSEITFIKQRKQQQQPAVSCYSSSIRSSGLDKSGRLQSYQTSG